MKLLYSFFLIVFCFVAVAQQPTNKARGPVDLHIDFVDGVLVFKPSQSCINNSCNANVTLLKQAITHIILKKPDNKEINSWLPIMVGGTKFYLTIYHFPFDASPPDTILHMENDSVTIHDIGADGLLADSTKEYCINKKTGKHLDWQSSYATLIQAGVCPIACLMQTLHEDGYNGYILQLMKGGHTGIAFY